MRTTFPHVFAVQAFLAHGDEVFHLDAIADLQFVELGLNLAVCGSHGTIPIGTRGRTTRPARLSAIVPDMPILATTAAQEKGR